MKLLGAILHFGNCLNAGNPKKGQADGFKISELTLTENIKDENGMSILQHICNALVLDDDTFMDFK